MKAEAVPFDINGLHTMLESMSKVLMDFSENAMVLFHSSTTLSWTWQRKKMT